MGKLGGYLVRAIAAVAARGIAFVRNKAVRNMMLGKLAKGTLKAAGAALLVEGAVYEVDKIRAPEKSEESMALDLKNAGIDPEAPLTERDLPRVLDVIAKHGGSAVAISRFRDALAREQAIDAEGSAKPSAGVPQKSPARDYSENSTQRVIESISHIAKTLGLRAERVPRLVECIMTVGAAQPDQLAEIQAISKMMVQDVG